MIHTRPLPPHLVRRYHGWRTTTFAESRSSFRTLAEKGQRPRAMVIGCCDSRVMIEQILGAEPGEFAVHRNIAALVPPFDPDGGLNGTSAAVEFVVTALEVPHVIVLGHSLCGGVKGCHDICAGTAPELTETPSFVGRWLEMLRPAYEKVAGIEDEGERLRALEQEAVLTSLTNLATFPYVAERIEAGDLELHGTWMDIGAGELHGWDPARDAFAAL